jgi:hypothetical protein
MSKVYENGYNGWKNRQTWNVALWINNDEPLYRSAVEYMKKHGTSERTGNPSKAPYIGFIRRNGLENERTPDGISFSGSRLDYAALNEMMRELLD